MLQPLSPIEAKALSVRVLQAYFLANNLKIETVEVDKFWAHFCYKGIDFLWGIGTDLFYIPEYDFEFHTLEDTIAQIEEILADE